MLNNPRKKKLVFANIMCPNSKIYRWHHHIIEIRIHTNEQGVRRRRLISILDFWKMEPTGQVRWDFSPWCSSGHDIKSFTGRNSADWPCPLLSSKEISVRSKRCSKAWKYQINFTYFWKLNTFFSCRSINSLRSFVHTRKHTFRA